MCKNNYNDKNCKKSFFTMTLNYEYMYNMIINTQNYAIYIEFALQILIFFFI